MSSNIKHWQVKCKVMYEVFNNIHISFLEVLFSKV